MKVTLLSLIVLLSASFVQAAEFSLMPAEKRDTVFFESDAKLEFIVGKTNNIVGGFSFDIDNPQDTIHGILKVDLNTLKTQISTRDEHMREQYLETDSFQFAYFELLSVQNMPKKIKQDSVYTVNCEGFFYLHGIKNKISPQLTIKVLTGLNNKEIDITAHFNILLEDYNIERPQLVLLKVAKQINISLLFRATQIESYEKIIIPSIYE